MADLVILVILQMTNHCFIPKIYSRKIDLKMDWHESYMYLTGIEQVNTLMS